MGSQFSELPEEQKFAVGGFVQGSVTIQLFEGESIVDRSGNIVATVINGELVHRGEGDP